MLNNSKRALSVCAHVILAFILLLPAIPGQQRAIVNPSTELPAMPIASNQRWNEGAFTGWLTTHPAEFCDNGTGSNNIPCRPFERWSNGFLSTFSATGAGTMFIELNADTNSMIYQPLCLANGESFDYSFVHRGRFSPTLPDVAQFRIGIPNGLPAGSRPADPYSYEIVQVATTSNGTVATAPFGSGTINTPVNAGNGWRRYSGTYTYTGPTQVVNIGFRAVSSGGGISYGNFIDDWQINLAPYIEVSASSDSGAEGTGGSNTPSNGPAIRVGGEVTTNVSVTVQVTGGNAEIGEDYSLTVPFESSNTNSTATIVIPPGIYDGTSEDSIFPVPFSINADGFLEPDESVNFTVSDVAGATVGAIASCGAVPTTTMSYTILNDDLAPTAAPVAIAGRIVTPQGRGIAGALVQMTSGSGVYQVQTNAFGYFALNGAEAGDLVILNVSAKRFKFEPETIAFTATENVADLVFVATDASATTKTPATTVRSIDR